VIPLENVTIAQGRDATFTCVVNNLGGHRVSGDGSSAPAKVCIGFKRSVEFSTSVLLSTSVPFRFISFSVRGSSVPFHLPFQVHNIQIT